jgi:hypothetical protein
MSTNKYQPHVLVLPEDDANRQIATGFILNESLNQRAIQVLPSAGGWKRVVDKFKDDYISTMLKYPHRRIILMIDFDDDQETRLSFVKNEIPEYLRNRVFVVGVKSEPENLKREIHKTFEGIGEALSNDCFENTNETWNHDLLIHNKDEVSRMILSVRPFLFQ